VADTAIPALRSALDVRTRSDGTVEIRDPVLLQILSVDARDYQVAAAFDGTLDADGVRRKVGRSVSKARVLSVAKEFRELHLLDTPEAKKAKPQKENVPPWSQLGSKRSIEVRPIAEADARWTCNGCGACCHNLAVELTPEEEGRIDGALYADVLGTQGFVEEIFISPSEPARRVLRQIPERDNACIFLAPDGLCWVHARQGMEHKPNACQMFPLIVLHVPRKPPRLGTRTNCQTMYETFEKGPNISVHTDHAMRGYKGYELHKAPARVEMFGGEISFSSFDRISNELKELLEERGLNDEALRHFDKKYLGGRVRKSRAKYAMRVLQYVVEEKTGGVPVQGGAYAESLPRVRRWKEALLAMASSLPPPAVAPRVSAFLRRQLGHVLYLCGPLNAPDAGYGFVALLLALEASMHAVGTREDLIQANHAFDVFTAPLVETLEHLWPLLEAIDARYARKVKEEMA
jgi:Fe-S-cluster containining protein